MKYVSTRGSAERLSFGEALSRGLAPDGGLYLPEVFPRFTLSDFSSANTFEEFAFRWLKPFLEGDALAKDLREICHRAFSFPTPLRELDPDVYALELFHGPTCAFKDVGARFLSECLSAVSSGKRKTVLVATSGDTGGAVASAFYRRNRFEVYILFPYGKISPRQEKQLTSWGENVRAFAVQGDFDDCQRIVKEAFQDPKWNGSRFLVSANSINLGRLLPQGAYYVSATCELARKKKGEPVFIIPSGNLGNATAALWVKHSGIPIRKVILSMNGNRAVADYWKTGMWKPLPTLPTLANAMDVGNPSNMERLRHLYPQFERFRDELRVITISDDEIKRAIQKSWNDWAQVVCPHTATGIAVLASLSDLAPPYVVVATAHPGKFEQIVEPILGRKVEIPPALEGILRRESKVREIAPTLEALKAAAD